MDFFKRILSGSKKEKNKKSQSGLSSEIKQRANELVSETYETKLATVDSLLKEEKYDEALEKLLQLRKTYPNDMGIFINLIFTYIKVERYNDCIQEMTPLIHLNPNLAILFNLRGLAYYFLEKYEETLADSVKAIELNPQETQAYLNCFNVYMVGLKNYEKALENANRLVEIDEKIGLLSRASVLSRMIRLEDAIDDLDKLISAYPTYTKAYNSRAWYKAYIEDYSNALEDADKAISLNSEVSNHWGTQGTIKWLLGDYQDALADFEKADEIIESGFVHTVEIAVTFMKLGRRDDAIRAWKTSISEDSKYQSAEAYQDAFLFPPPFYEAMQELEELANDN